MFRSDLNDERMRMLGARDGLVTALALLRCEVDGLALRGQAIDPRHTRKLAEHARQIAPLQRIEMMLAERLAKLETL